MKKKAAGKLNYIVLIIVVVILFLLYNKGSTIRYTVAEGNIHINWFSAVDIPLKEITEIKLLEETPKMDKVMGVELFNIRQGTFSIEGIGRVKVYSPDIRRQMVLIKTDKMTYGVTPENPKEFIRHIDIN